MKLQLIHDFELEVDGTTYSGQFKDLTKKQIKTIDKLSPTKELKQLKKLQRQEETPSVLNEMDAILEVIEEYDTEDIYKKRLELSITGDDKKYILGVGEQYGYSRVFDTIIEDIAERKSGN